MESYICQASGERLEYTIGRQGKCLYNKVETENLITKIGLRDEQELTHILRYSESSGISMVWDVQAWVP